MSSLEESCSRNMEEYTTQVNLGMARNKFDISVNQLEDDYFETLDENFTSVLKKRGRLFLSTKIRNIMSPESILHYFSRKLAEDLKQQDVENSSVSYSAEIIAIGWSGDNSKQLKIVVESIDSKNKKKPKKVVYTGLFFSWQLEESTDEDYYDLPFLFSIGPDKLLSTMNNLFEEYLGCKIKAAALSQHEIRWLMVLMLYHLSRESMTRSMRVIYRTQSNPIIMELTYTSGILKDVWMNIHDENTSEITFKEVCLLHNALEEHILETLRIDLSYFHLKRFSVADLVTIDVSGRLQMDTADVINLVYRFLSKR